MKRRFKQGGERGRDRIPLRFRRTPTAWEQQRPTWQDARPALIDSALKRALARPSGNWYVLGDTKAVRPGAPYGRTIAGVEVVAWRDNEGRLIAGPGACPHLGAPLRDSRVSCGTLICHWHGMALNGAPFAGWEPFPAHDDGVLAWVRLDAIGGEQPLDRPILPERPSLDASVAAIYTTIGVCEPEDVVANRLDPWHGAWFHPYSFVDLTVVQAPATSPETDAGGAPDAFAVQVSFKVASRLVVPVTAAFTAPEPRTVVMHITDGEGKGSVVEAHATPLGSDLLGRPSTMVVEAVIASSDRPGFTAARATAPFLRPLLRAVSARLWRDDLAYAERRWQLRGKGCLPN
ncbi:DUF5914 domain-containing protein [Streptomyces sp. SCSIO 30461]|uniref:DUF5914 domain-containing protein n=1 Tax=Streptomyces sp. SCSIO 30461 TaxID=3118085 RepID=UPI0030CCE808